jgi:hypothetical protein
MMLKTHHYLRNIGLTLQAFIVVIFQQLIYITKIGLVMKNQTKKHSLIESIIQTLIGLITSIIVQLILYPILNIPVTLKQNIIITIVFFVVSVVRGYLVRRFFNKIHF